MIWQFGELGYDYSINTCSDGVTISEDCRVAAKPVRWDYRESASRYRIYQVMSALSGLKRDHPVFQTTDFNWDVWGYGKRLHLNGNDMNVVVVANFNATALSLTPGFQHTGTWHDYFSGESIEVTDLNASTDLNPGEYHLWTDVPLATPDNILGIHEAKQEASFSVAPNPGTLPTVSFHSPAEEGMELTALDITGRVAYRAQIPVGTTQWTLPTALPSGPYLLRSSSSRGSSSVHWLNP